jgi:molybdopterin-guanine dinucleotide biosynthesis protein A
MTPDPRSNFTVAILAGGQARWLGEIDDSALSAGTRPTLDRRLALRRRWTPDIPAFASDAAPFREAGLAVIPDRIRGVGALDTPDDDARAGCSAGAAATADR